MFYPLMLMFRHSAGKRRGIDAICLSKFDPCLPSCPAGQNRAPRAFLFTAGDINLMRKHGRKRERISGRTDAKNTEADN